MKKVFVFALIGFGLLLSSASVSLAAEVPAGDQPLIASGSATQQAAVKADEPARPILGDETLALIDPSLAPAPTATGICLCATFKSTCADTCGFGNYDFFCSRYDHVSCTCLDGSGGWIYYC